MSQLSFNTEVSYKDPKLSGFNTKVSFLNPEVPGFIIYASFLGKMGFLCNTKGLFSNGIGIFHVKPALERI